MEDIYISNQDHNDIEEIVRQIVLNFMWISDVANKSIEEYRVMREMSSDLMTVDT